MPSPRFFASAVSRDLVVPNEAGKPSSLERRLLELERSAPLAVSLIEAGRMMGGVSMWTVKREILRGNLRGLRVGRQWRVQVAEIHAYLKRQTVD